MMKTETELLNAIFNPMYLKTDTLNWVCSGSMGSSNVAYENEEMGRRRIVDHLHVDGDCTYSQAITWKLLPRTEVDFADALAEFIGTSTLVYVPAMDEWQIMDDGVYRALSGDWFVHNCIRRYTERYAAIVEGDEDKGLVGIHAMIKQELDAAEDFASTSKGDPESVREVIAELKAEAWDEYGKKSSPIFRLLSSLKSERGIKSVTTLMKSALCEFPATRTNSKFLGIGHLIKREVKKPLVDGIIPATGLGQIYGAPYTGKTFAAIDLALSVCAGLGSWMGSTMNLEGAWVEDGEGGNMDMTQHVVYVAAEGGQPFWNAVEGWKEAHPHANLDKLHVLDCADGASFVLSDKTLPPGVYGLEDLKRDLAESGIKPRMVVIDPQANVTPGVDENSTALAHALQPLKDWADKDEILAILIHHSGKTDGNGPRGSSAQAAMMDLLIEFKRTVDSRQMHFQKVKGSPQPDQPIKVALQDVTTASGESRAYLSHAGAVIPKAKVKDMQMLETRSTITSALGNGETSARSIAIAFFGTESKRTMVNNELEKMASEGLAQNEGSSNRPKWVLIPSSTPVPSSSSEAVE